MSDPRSMIIERVRAGGSGRWTLDVFLYLVSNGVSDDDAIEAMRLFVDEIIELKQARQPMELIE
jgi:hypothetical protein